VLGMYVRDAHRKPSTITLLTQAAISKAEELKVSDIDLLISIDQTGIQALLERSGFVKAAIQYTKYFEISGTDLPSLHSSHLKLGERENIPFKKGDTVEVIVLEHSFEGNDYPLRDRQPYQYEDPFEAAV
jgi:hypothetical protein